MGLDVYMYKCDDLPAHQAWEKRREIESERVPYDGATYSERMDAWDAEHPDPSPESQVEIDSRVHPEHMFKIGYLRSSYNGGGIENVLSTSTAKDLHWIFENEDAREYILRPDWGRALKRATEARDALALHVKEHGSFGITRAVGNMFDPGAGPTDDESAMAIFREKRATHIEREKNNPSQPGWDMSAFGCREGEFWLGEPLKVHALIPGTKNLLGKRACTYAVFEKDMTWYQQALQIVVEMCEWVISQPDAQKHYLHWSG